MIDETDKREKERVAPTGQLEGAVMVFQPMTIVEISHNGAQIETPFPLQLDSLHEFRLSLGERSVVVKGRIVHCYVGELRNDILSIDPGSNLSSPPSPSGTPSLLLSTRSAPRVGSR